MTDIPKVFITGVDYKGKKGFIGSNLINFLESFPSEGSYVTLKGDMKNTNSVERQMLGRDGDVKCDTVIHLAGLHRIEDGQNNPDLFFKNNVDGTWSVLQAALRTKVKKFIFISSLAVVYNRRTTYAMTKIMQEEMIRTYSDKMTVITLRLASVYDREHGTIGWLLNNTEPLGLYGIGEQVRDFIHIEDVVDVIDQTLKWTKGGFTCDIGTGLGTSMIELAKLAGRKYTLIPDPNPQFNPSFSVANPVPAQEILGFVPYIKYRDFIVQNSKNKDLIWHKG